MNKQTEDQMRQTIANLDKELASLLGRREANDEELSRLKAEHEQMGQRIVVLQDTLDNLNRLLPTVQTGSPATTPAYTVGRGWSTSVEV